MTPLLLSILLSSMFTEGFSFLHDGSLVGEKRSNPTIMAASMSDTTNSNRKLTFQKTQEALLEDWALCTCSTSCSNGCCSAKYSRDGQLRCTPLAGGFHSDVCVQSSILVPEEASSTVSTTATPQIGTCGFGSRGNGVCSDGSCCSVYGWCGTTAAHCSHPEGSGVPIKGTCGYGNLGNGICANGTCCSQFGWCGTTEDHCSHASTLSPSLAPITATSSEQGDVDNGTTSGTSPAVTSPPIPRDKSNDVSTIVAALIGVVVGLILGYLIHEKIAVGLRGSKNDGVSGEKPAQSNSPAFQFWNWVTTAETVDSDPENVEAHRPSVPVDEPFEEQSIADQSLYTTPSYIWQSEQPSRYPLRYPSSMVSVMGESMAGFSMSGVSLASTSTEESGMFSDVQDAIAFSSPAQDLEQPSR